MKTLSLVCIAGAVLFNLSGCTFSSYGAYTNTSLNHATPDVKCNHKEILETLPTQTSFVVREGSRIPQQCEGVKITEPKRNKNVLVLLALSGGGSRAAYFSALSMLEMQKMKLSIDGVETDLLHEVDVISSVSGGSLAGAYYAVSHDPESECAGYSKRLVWDINKVDEVRALMLRNYRSKWIGNWFWPSNIAANWFTNFDRTDIMAQTFADNLFDKSFTGKDLRISELNPLRPNLILNATTGSRGEGGHDIPFGQTFTFTTEDFARIGSSIQDYSVARAVMATAALPGVFSYMTVRDFCSEKNNDPGTNEDARYLHLFDGGTADNLGLTSLKRVIWKSLKNPDTKPTLTYDKVVVILVDAFTNSRGADAGESDPRNPFDFFVDTNILDATDSLLEANREKLLSPFKHQEAFFPFGQVGATKEISNEECRKFFHGAEKEKYCTKDSAYWKDINQQIKDKLNFVHLTFEKVQPVTGCLDKAGRDDPACLKSHLLRIPTDFKLSSKPHKQGTKLSDEDAISCAVPTLFGQVGPEGYCGNLKTRPAQELDADWQRVRSILENSIPPH